MEGLSIFHTWNEKRQVRGTEPILGQIHQMRHLFELVYQSNSVRFDLGEYY